jgi:hypothetical protein
MQEAKDSKIPLDTGYFRNNLKDDLLQDNKLYRQVIGALLYVSTNTRPDIAVAVSILSRKITCPTQKDWTEVKRILRYLKGTQSLKLIVGKGKIEVNGNLTGYADADFAGDSTTYRSNSGYIFYYNGSTLSWACRKQSSIALSSTEAEYIAISEAVQEAMWLKSLFSDFGQELDLPIIIYEDNQSCLKLLENERINTRTKHIGVKYQFSRQAKLSGDVDFIYCPTDMMIADFLTKPLQAAKLKQLRELAGLK